MWAKRCAFVASTIASLVSSSDAELDAAAQQVLRGGVVAYPTDTVYGLGCDPFNSESVDRLVRAKQRTKGALPILVDSMSSARRLGEFDKTSTILAGRFWPGPLTLILSVREKFPDAVTDASQFIGLRMPKHGTALELITKCGGRLIGTSANISGHLSPRTAQEVLNELGNSIDLVIDGGPTPLGKESTVVKTIGKQVNIVRAGAISQDEILIALRMG